MTPTDGYVLLGCLVLFCGVVILELCRKLKKWEEKFNKLNEKYSRELSIRKSSEIRLGKIGENLAPFVQDWPWEPGNFRFLGNPVDGVQFNSDGIIFVEIKTGKARLSPPQRAFKKLVQEGKVSFATFKITDGGCKLQQTE